MWCGNWGSIWTWEQVTSQEWYSRKAEATWVSYSCRAVTVPARSCLPLYLYVRKKKRPFCLSHSNPEFLLQPPTPLEASFSLHFWDSLSIIRHCHWWEGMMVTFYWKPTGPGQESRAWGSEDWSSGSINAPYQQRELRHDKSPNIHRGGFSICAYQIVTKCKRSPWIEQK